MNASNQADLLRSFLAEADVPCPGCGYNLRGLREQACPECSTPITLTVTRGDFGPKWGWIAVWALMACGVYQVLALFIDVYQYMTLSMPSMPLVYKVLDSLQIVGNVLVLVAALFGVVRYRRHSRRNLAMARREVVGFALTLWLVETAAFLAWALAGSILP